MDAAQGAAVRRRTATCSTGTTTTTTTRTGCSTRTRRSDSRDRIIVSGSVAYKARRLAERHAALGHAISSATTSTSSSRAGNLHLQRPELRRRVLVPARRTAARTTPTCCSPRTAQIVEPARAQRRRSAATCATRARSTEGVEHDRHLGAEHLQRLERRRSRRRTSQFFSSRRVNSVYGSASFTLDDWLTVEGTARNDWSSTLPEANNSYFYPVVNTSIVLTRGVPVAHRAGRAQLRQDPRRLRARSGADATPYQLRSDLPAASPTSSARNPLYTLSNVLANADLKPENTLSSEAGPELGFAENRVTLDASVYRKRTLRPDHQPRRVIGVGLHLALDQRRRDREQGRRGARVDRARAARQRGLDVDVQLSRATAAG